MLFSFAIPELTFFDSKALPKLILLETLSLTNLQDVGAPIASNHDFKNLFYGIYLVIFTIFLVRFLRNVFSIIVKISKNDKLIINNNTIVLLDDNIVPHTFMQYIFVNKITYNLNHIPNEILLHEKTHSKQLHSLDVLIIEIMKIIFWFNPLLYFYKNAIQINHEFIADSYAIKNHSIAKYQSILLEFISFQKNDCLTSNFNYSITNKRFLMMTKKSNPARILISKLLVIPILLVAIFTFSNHSFAQSEPVLTQLGKDVIAPQFPGGISKFYFYFMRNFKAPDTVQSVNGKINMTFVIEKDGSLSDIKVLKSNLPKLSSTIIATLKNAPKWIAATKNGVPVRVQYNLPIKIVLQ